MRLRNKWAEANPITNDQDRTLRDLVNAIKRGDRDDALAMLERYVPNAAAREIVQRHMR